MSINLKRLKIENNKKHYIWRAYAFKYFRKS